MSAWFASLSSLQWVFALSAMVGGLLFFIQLILMFLTGGGDDVMDLEDGADVDHADADTSFKLLSFQGMTAFFMMFGLVGLAMNLGSGFGPGTSMIVATGDVTQVDLPDGSVSGMVDAQRVLRGIVGVRFAYLFKEDIVRHPLVQEIVDAYENRDRPREEE